MLIDSNIHWLTTYHAKIFNKLGWKALWKIITKELSQNIEWFTYPDFQVIQIDDLLAGKFVNNMVWKKVVFKFSWVNDDFSINSSRWKNTSVKSPKEIVSKNVKDQIIWIFGYEKISQFNAIILEEFISSIDPYEYIVHIDWEEIMIEMWYWNIRYIFVFDLYWKKLIVYPSSEIAQIHLDTINQIRDIHVKLYNQLWFSINTEWFYENNQYKSIQLRSIPNDYRVDKEIRYKIQWNQSNDSYYTRFVHSSFEQEWIILNIDDLECFWNNPQIILIKDLDTTRDIPIIRKRLKSGLQTVILDITRWFHLSHRPDYLPPVWDIRNQFKYISLPWVKEELLYRKYVKIMSDGTQWIVDLDNDRNYQKECNIVYLEPNFYPSREKVTSVLVFPFCDEENIVTTINNRWIDIPWWHIEESDKSFEDTAFRETLEETWVEIADLQYIWMLQSDYFWTDENSLTYILLYASNVSKINDYMGNLECIDRKIINYNVFLSQYQGKVINKELMKFLINLSKHALNNRSKD